MTCNPGYSSDVTDTQHDEPVHHELCTHTHNTCNPGYSNDVTDTQHDNLHSTDITLFQLSCA